MDPGGLVEGWSLWSTITAPIVVAALVGVGRHVIRRIRRFRPGSESPWRRSYWNARLDERIAQAKDWKTPATRRRVDAALAQLDASEAMRWSPQPGAAFSWILAVIAYIAAIGIRVVGDPAWWGWGGALLFVLIGAGLQVDALTAPERRRELQSVLAHIASSARTGHDLVARDPQEVIGAWNQCRKRINRPSELSPFAQWTSRVAPKWPWLRQRIPWAVKHPAWWLGRQLGITNYTTQELADDTLLKVRTDRSSESRSMRTRIHSRTDP